MATRARLFLKVYDKTGTTVETTIDSGAVVSIGRIVREVGKPASPVDVRIAFPWDSFGYGDTIHLYDFVKVYAVNPANPGGVIVFQGHVTEIVARLSGSENGVTLRVFPVDALLPLAFFKDGASFTKSYAAADVDTMFSDVITHINSVQGATFFTSSLGNPGLSITTDFVELTHLGALLYAASFLGSTWRWRVNASGLISLAEWSDATATHKLTIGKDVLSVEVTNSIADVKNGVLLRWGAGPTDALYTDATSQTAYGVRQKKVVDANIGNSGSADEYGDGEVARLKDAKLSTRIVVSPEYAIETILPGDTVSVRNLSSGSQQMLSGVRRVVRTEYDGATCVLHLDDIRQIFGSELALALA